MKYLKYMAEGQGPQHGEMGVKPIDAPKNQPDFKKNIPAEMRGPMEVVASRFKVGQSTDETSPSSTEATSESMDRKPEGDQSSFKDASSTLKSIAETPTTVPQASVETKAPDDTDRKPGDFANYSDAAQALGVARSADPNSEYMAKTQDELREQVYEEPQESESPAWTEEDASKFRGKLVEIGLISETPPDQTPHVVPEDSLPLDEINMFLRAKGVKQDYFDSLNGLPQEEQHFRADKLYRGAFSEKARREFETSLQALKFDLQKE